MVITKQENNIFEILISSHVVVGLLYIYYVYCVY